MWKQLLVVATVGVAIAAATATTGPSLPRLSDAECASAFDEWQDSYDKHYDSVEEELARQAVFCDNLAWIRTQNARSQGRTTFAANAFADQTPAELKTRRMPARAAPSLPAWQYAPPVHQHRGHGHGHAASLPAEFDWAAPSVSPAVVTPVRDQGSVGSCWAFSTAENIEGQWALAHKQAAVELSPEWLVDCANATNPTNGNEDCGVFGGWPYLTYEYIIGRGGIQSEQAYPYCSGFGNCYPCDAPGTNLNNCGPPPPNCNATQNQCGAFTPAASIKSWVAISADEQQIAAQLVQRGPLSVLLDASWLNFYSSGIFNPGALCSKTALDHAVLLTGYGTQNGTDYWVVKNSWSDTWGMKGYFWIIRGTGECGINTAVTTAQV